jgi:ubiquitin carboxyl-terminal hydrolase 7
VHSGDVHGGHYYAYIRPSSDPQSDEWFKFDDETVTRVTQHEVMDDSYGVRTP